MAKTKNNKKANQKKVPDVIKDYVKSQISVKAENFKAPPVIENFSQLNHYGSTATGTVSTILNLLEVCQLVQGTGQGQRKGNDVSVKKLLFKGHIIPNSITTAGYNTMMLRMFIFRDKFTIDVPTNFSDLLQNGNSVLAPSNLQQDMYLKFNKDNYIIYKEKTFKLSYQYSNYNGLNYIGQFSYDLAKFVKKLKYNDSAVDPTSHALYVGFMVAPLVGSTPLGAAEVPAYISYVQEFEYEDV